MPRRTRFSIEAVLSQRRQAELVARQSFARAAGEVAGLRLRLGWLGDSARSADARARQELLSGRGDSACYREQVRRLRGSAIVGRRNLADARRRMEERRLELLEAVTQRKSLCWLRGKLSRSLALAADRRDARQADELHAVWQLAAGGSEDKE